MQNFEVKIWHSRLNYSEAILLVLKKSIPVAVSRVIFTANSLVFGFALRRLGKDAEAAGSIITTLQYFGTGSSYGVLLSSGVLIGEKYGSGQINSKEYRDIGKISRASWMVAGVFYLMTAAFFITVPRVLNTMGAIEKVVEVNVNEYFLYYGLIGLFPILVGVSDQQLAAATKDGLLPILFNLIYSGIASGLGWPMTLGKFGVWFSGTRGYGISTGIAAWLSLLIGRLYYRLKPKYRDYDLFSLDFNNNHFYFKELLKLGWRTGAQAFVEFLHLAGTSVILFSLAGSHTELAATPALLIASAIGMVSIGYGQVQGTLIANERGIIEEALQRGNREMAENAKHNITMIGYTGTILGSCFSLGPAMLCWLKSDAVSAVFLNHDEVNQTVTAESLSALEIGALGLVIDMLRNTLSGNLKGFRDVNYASVVSFLLMDFLFFIASALLLINKEDPLVYFMWIRNAFMFIAAAFNGYRWYQYDTQSPQEQLGYLTKKYSLFRDDGHELTSSPEETIKRLDQKVCP